MPKPFYQDEWDFSKLFIGLNTASIGGIFIAQDKLVYSRMTAILFALTVVLLALSTVAALLCLRILIWAQLWVYSGEDAKDAPRVAQFTKLGIPNHYMGYVRFTAGSFGLAYLLAAVLMLTSLWHKHLPWL